MTFLVICRAITFRLVRTDIYPRSMAAIAAKFSRSGRYRRTDDDDPVHSLIDRTLPGRQNDEDCAPWPSSSADWISERLTSYCCSAACELTGFPSTTACTGTVSPPLLRARSLSTLGKPLRSSSCCIGRNLHLRFLKS